MGIHWCGWCGNMSGGGFHEKSAEPYKTFQGHGNCSKEYAGAHDKLISMFKDELKEEATKLLDRLLSAEANCE